MVQHKRVLKYVNKGHVLLPWRPTDAHSWHGRYYLELECFDHLKFEYLSFCINIYEIQDYFQVISTE